MSRLPKVAVIIANYNYGKWVKEAIMSVVDQKYDGEIKIFVVDDASTDHSVHAIKVAIDNIKFLGHENKIEFVGLAQNSGPSVARNVAIKLAITDFNPDVFMVLDADDKYYPNKVDRSVKEWLKDKNGIGAVYADYHIVGNDDCVKCEYKPAFSYQQLLKTNIVHSNSLFSKKAIETVGLYDEKFRYATCEDYDLWLRIGQKFVIKHIPEFLMAVRSTGINASNITDNNKQLWQDSMQYLREKHGKKLYSKN